MNSNYNTSTEILLQRLIEIRQHIRQELPKVLADAHSHFLISFVRVEPLVTDATRAPQGLASDPLATAQPKKLCTTNKVRFGFQGSELMDRFS